MKFLYFTILFLFAICCPGTALASVPVKKVSVTQYGAKGNGVADDTKAIVNAINAGDVITFPKGIYNISGPVTLAHLNNKSIIATGAVIQNTTDKATLVFDHGSNISITGGTWTHKGTLKEGVGSEHALTFVGTSNIKVQQVIINGSAEMGICMICVIGGVINGNTIKNCYRDGIYSHYSAKLTITNNKLDNIKDDAISMHDYGLDKQKPELLKINLKQAGHSTISHNQVNRAFQGFSSIGCQDVIVSNNVFQNTVNAGIAVFNSVKLFEGSTARANHITIQYNKLAFNGGTQTIMGKAYTNGGQLSGGRAALFVAALDKDNLVNNPETWLSDIIITNNTISNSYVNGCYAAQIKGLTFKSNSFTNCDIDQSRFSGRIVEISNCTSADIAANSVLDNRAKPLHDAGYQLKNIKGKATGWVVKGYRDKVQGYTY